MIPQEKETISEDQEEAQQLRSNQAQLKATRLSVTILPKGPPLMLPSVAIGDWHEWTREVSL